MGKLRRPQAVSEGHERLCAPTEQACQRSPDMGSAAEAYTLPLRAGSHRLDSIYVKNLQGNCKPPNTQ